MFRIREDDMARNIKWLFVLGLILLIVAPVAGKGPPGGGEEIPDIGELYGDLYVILRDEDGIPMLDAYGCIQPISGDLDGDGVLDAAISASVLIDTYDGIQEITAFEGEPFTLATYIDAAGDEVECELTEEMAVWAQAVDFGRLNLGRAPDEVINHAFDEAIKNMNLATAIGIDPVGRLELTFGDGTVKTIDSPAENLALYIKMMKDGHWITEDTTVTSRGNRPPEKGPPEGDGPADEPRPVLGCADPDCEQTTEAITYLNALGYDLGDVNRTNANLTRHELQFAASLLAAAADKTGNITLDKVVYINSVYDINQAGSLPGEIEGKTYFDYSAFTDYSRNLYNSRSSGACVDGSIWVLQPDMVNGEEVPNHFEAQCMEILGYDPADENPVNAVRFVNMIEVYTTVPLEYDFVDNVRGFAQASDDALQVLEYIHNYKVPEVLYPDDQIEGVAVKDFASTSLRVMRSLK
jgi:hypothetical protein